MILERVASLEVFCEVGKENIKVQIGSLKSPKGRPCYLFECEYLCINEQKRVYCIKENKRCSVSPTQIQKEMYKKIMEQGKGPTYH